MMPESFRECLDAARDCAQECEACCGACIDMNHPECVKKTGDCAHICWTLSSFIGRSSEFSPYLAKVCEEICESCEKECLKYQDSDHHMKCASACRRCAEACRKIAPSAMAGFTRATRGAQASQNIEAH